MRKRKYTPYVLSVGLHFALSINSPRWVFTNACRLPACLPGFSLNVCKSWHFLYAFIETFYTLSFSLTVNYIELKYVFLWKQTHAFHFFFILKNKKVFLFFSPTFFILFFPIQSGELNMEIREVAGILKIVKEMGRKFLLNQEVFFMTIDFWLVFDCGCWFYQKARKNWRKIFCPSKYCLAAS